MRKPSVPRTCLNCGKAFFAWPYQIRIGQGRFCSQRCAYDCRPIETEGARFARLLVKGAADECWVWSGPRSRAGYGLLDGSGRAGFTMYAHRYAMALHLGVPYKELPELCVCHRCDNPPCCNPAHLFLGTDADNHNDKARKLRAAFKLDPARVQAIRSLAAEGVSIRDIARQFGIASSTTAAIVKRRIWKHVA